MPSPQTQAAQTTQPGQPGQPQSGQQQAQGPQTGNGADADQQPRRVRKGRLTFDGCNPTQKGFAMTRQTILPEEEFGPPEVWASKAFGYVTCGTRPHPDFPTDGSKMLSITVEFGTTLAANYGVLATNNPLFLDVLYKEYQMEKAHNGGQTPTVAPLGEFVEAHKPAEIKVTEQQNEIERLNRIIAEMKAAQAK